MARRSAGRAIQGGAACHIAADHLGAPRQIVNSANAQVWYWDHHPFGETRSITAAAGFRHELRFPGHIYDSETGLHNNGFRDYWPFLGRYIESDPIGIAGGIGTYSYAGNNPVNTIDPFGLDPKSKDDQEALPDIDVAGQQNVVEAGLLDIFRMFKFGTKVERNVNYGDMIRIAQFFRACDKNP